MKRIIRISKCTDCPYCIRGAVIRDMGSEFVYRCAWCGSDDAAEWPIIPQCIIQQSTIADYICPLEKDVGL